MVSIRFLSSTDTEEVLHSLYQLVIIWIRNVKVLNQLTKGYLLLTLRGAMETRDRRITFEMTNSFDSGE